MRPKPLPQGGALATTGAPITGLPEGARSGNRLNVLQNGRNCGWPLMARGEECPGEPFPGAVADQHGYEQSVHYWHSVLAFWSRVQRVRDVRQGPDGALYLVSDKKDRELRKIVPRG